MMCDDSGAQLYCLPYIYYNSVYADIKGIYDGQSKPNTQVALSINYAMPI